MDHMIVGRGSTHRHMKSMKKQLRSRTPSSYSFTSSGTNDTSEVDAHITKRRKLHTSSITSLSPIHSHQRASSSLGFKDAEGSTTPLQVPPFCMISNTLAEEENLHSCHVIPLDIPHDELSKLQFSWGLRQGELSLDSPNNTIILTSQLYHAFRSGAWALVPVDGAIIHHLRSMYIKSLRWRELQCDKERMMKVYRGVSEFEYVLYPFQEGGGENLSFRRRNETIMNSNGDTYTTHSFPFGTLPRFRSHLLPHFAIYDLVKKMYKSKITSSPLLVIEPYHLKLIQQVTHIVGALMIAKGVYDKWQKAQVPPHYTDDNPLVDKDEDTTPLAGLLGPNDSSSIRSGGTGESDDEKDPWGLLLGRPLRDKVETWQRDVLPLETPDNTCPPVEASAGPLKATASVEQTTITN